MEWIDTHANLLIANKSSPLNGNSRPNRHKTASSQRGSATGHMLMVEQNVGSYHAVILELIHIVYTS